MSIGLFSQRQICLFIPPLPAALPFLQQPFIAQIHGKGTKGSRQHDSQHRHGKLSPQAKPSASGMPPMAACTVALGVYAIIVKSRSFLLRLVPRRHTNIRRSPFAERKGAAAIFRFRCILTRLVRLNRRCSTSNPVSSRTYRTTACSSASPRFAYPATRI